MSITYISVERAEEVTQTSEGNEECRGNTETSHSITGIKVVDERTHRDPDRELSAHR